MLIKVLISQGVFFPNGWIMGFLRFLKRGKSQTDELDLPPAPPSPMDFGDLDKDFSAPMPGDEMFSQLGFSSPSGKMNEFPSFDDLQMPGDTHGDIQKLMPENRIPTFLQQPMPNAPERQMPMTAPMHEHHVHHGKSTYVRVQDFRQMMVDLNQIRSDLRKGGLWLTEMLGTIANREKDYSRYRNSLMDIQKKLVFMDKTIFKGEPK